MILTAAKIRELQLALASGAIGNGEAISTLNEWATRKPGASAGTIIGRLAEAITNGELADESVLFPAASQQRFPSRLGDSIPAPVSHWTATGSRADRPRG